MKHFFSFACLLFLSGFYVIGQNLVLNPSFEEYTECPSSFSVYNDQKLYDVNGWEPCNIAGTPDYFHVCAHDPIVRIPENITVGYSFPNSGDAFVGFYGFTIVNILGIDFLGYEDIKNKLTSSSIPNKIIHISFYIKLASSSGYIANNFSVLLRNDMCPELAVIDMVYPNYSDFTYCEMIDKSDNWLLISGSFSVKEAFNYLHIGNFYELNRTQYIQKYPMSGTNSNASYYFVDDVCLSHNPATCPARQLDLLPPTATCVDGQVVLDAGPGSVHYAWVYDGQPLPCDTGQTIVADRAGWYRVVVGRQQSCGSVYTFTDSVFVSGQCRARLQPCEPSPLPPHSPTFALPSAFSPNNDGLNDIWPGWALPPADSDGGLSDATRVTIYSRWGVAVYSGPLHPGWDGRAPDGTPAPEGVYAYTLHTPAGQLRSGTVTLVR